MPTSRSISPAILLILAASVSVAAQGRSPLLDEIVVSVRKASPKWHFIPAVCTCPALVPSQSSYAFGGWHLGKLTSPRRVQIYVSYVPTEAIAADWMSDLGRRNVETGWWRTQYRLGDEASLWTSDSGYAYLYFRSGSIVVEISGALNDVKFFAPHANWQLATVTKRLERPRP